MTPDPLWALQIDYTIKLSDLFLVGGGIIAFFKVFYRVTTVMRDTQSRLDRHGRIIGRHDGWIAELRGERRRRERRKGATAEEAEAGMEHQEDIAGV